MSAAMHGSASAGLDRGVNSALDGGVNSALDGGASAGSSLGANAGAGLLGAQRAIGAARRVAAVRGAARPRLAWDDLVAWPSWALDDAACTDALAARLAALWYAAALRRSIDGRCLHRAGALVGQAWLREIVAAPRSAADEPGASALPPLEHFDAAWRDAGRALLLASIERPSLREAVAAQLRPSGEAAWPPAAAIAPARAQRLLAQALALPMPGASQRPAERPAERAFEGATESTTEGATEDAPAGATEGTP